MKQNVNYANGITCYPFYKNNLSTLNFSFPECIKKGSPIRNVEEKEI